MKRTVYSKSHRALMILSCLVAIIGCDQITKSVAKDTLAFSNPLSYMDDTLRLQYSENPGAFLSLGAALPESFRFWIFSVTIPFCLLLAGFFLFVRRTSNLTTVGLVMVVGGGIGNLIDRLTYGRVVDFINLGFGNIRTGIFNVADVAIMAGVLVLSVETLKMQPSQKLAPSKRKK